MTIEEKRTTLLTPAVLSLIGQTSEISEMYGVIDEEILRRFILGIPDQDPRYWDEALAKPRFGATTMPPLFALFAFGERPPWDTSRTEQVRDEDSDGTGFMDG